MAAMGARPIPSDPRPLHFCGAISPPTAPYSYNSLYLP